MPYKKEPAAQEQGHFYPAELPDYPEGQTGKGATIGGKVTAKSGTPLPIGNDSYAKELKKEWNQAERAKSRFGKPA